MTDRLKHFDILSKHGMQIIPLLSGEKKPILDGWQLGYDPVECRRYVERNPSVNLGLRLGDIVDVEGDSAHANALVNRLIGDYPHPAYKSRKSIHHLFLTPDPKLTRIVFQDVEFRGNRHQSVLPPSVVGDATYTWISAVFPIPPMPERLLDFFKKIKRKKGGSTQLKPGHMKLPCAQCRKPNYIHKKRFQEELAAFKSFGQQWHCRECRTIDLRPICRSIRDSDLLEVG